LSKPAGSEYFGKAPDAVVTITQRAFLVGALFIIPSFWSQPYWFPSSDGNRTGFGT
jgi:hypothetical protein